jgi:hypothetical protein
MIIGIGPVVVGLVILACFAVAFGIYLVICVEKITTLNQD